MKKKIVVIVIVCVLLAGGIAMIGMGVKGQNVDMAATADTDVDYIAPFKTPGPTRAPLVRGIPTRKP